MSAAALYGGLSAFQLWAGGQQADSIMKSGRLRYEIGQMNARYAELDAWEAEQFGYSQSARYQNVIDTTIGEQDSFFAEQDIDVNSAMAQELKAETQLIGRLNILDFQKAARQKARGLKIEASNLRLNADMGLLQSRIDASAARTQSIAGAIQTGATGYARS